MLVEGKYDVQKVIKISWHLLRGQIDVWIWARDSNQLQNAYVYHICICITSSSSQNQPMRQITITNMAESGLSILNENQKL